MWVVCWRRAAAEFGRWMLGNMEKQMKFLTVLLLFLLIAISAQGGSHKTSSTSPSRYIDALVSAPHLVVYSEDGAADATVVENPVVEVRSILKLGARAIPLLIAHLGDTRLTAAKFGRDQARRVPVGYVCLDILSNIVRSKRILVEDCADDGLGACIKDGYYFRPDAYSSKSGRLIPQAQVFKVQTKWKRAYRNGYLTHRHLE
jgi:hypothetical protein